MAWREFGGHTGRQPDTDGNESTTSPTSTSDVAAAETLSTPQAQIIAVVEEDGFDLRLGPVRVSAPGGVAAPGTRVAVSLPDGPPPAELSSLTRVVGPAVSVVLGNGQQPKRSIAIVFDLSGTEIAANVSDESPLAVMSWSGTPESWAIAAGAWDTHAQTLSIESDHLTGFWTILIDIKKFVADTVSGLLGLSFPKPGCAFDPLTIGSTPYSIVHDGEDPIWPCLSTSDGHLLVDLHSNSNMAWAVTTDPSVTGRASGDYKDLGPGLAAIYQGLAHLLGTERSAVMPGGSARFRFDPKGQSIRIEANQEPALFVVATTLQVVISVLEALPTGRVAEFVLASFSTYDCFSEVINTFYQDDSAEIARSVVVSTLNCLPGLIDAAAKNAQKSVSQLIVSSAAAVVGMLIAGANAIWGNLQGIYRELTGAGTVSYTITAGALPGISASNQASAGHGPRFDEPIVVKWRYEKLGGIYSPPAIVNGTIYTGRKTTLLALDVRTGIERWHFDNRDEIYPSPVVVGGMVYIKGNRPHSSLMAIDAATGKERWRIEQNAPTMGAPAVANGIVYAGDGNGSIIAFDATSGARIWRVPADPYFGSTPVIAGGSLFFGGNDGYLYSLDATSGSARWRFFAGKEPTTPTVADTTVYVGTRAGQLHAVDAETGDERWRFTSENWIFSTPTVADELVYVDGQSILHALDTQTGVERWSFPTPGDRVHTSLAVSNGIVYVTGDYLYALNAATGKEYWRFALESVVTQPQVAVGEGIVCVSNEDMNLVAFGNLPQMTLMRTTPIRVAPSQTGIERGTVSVGESVIYRGSHMVGSGTTWFEVAVGGITGWIPLDAIDPTTAPPNGEIEYVYVPDSFPPGGELP